MDDWAATPGIPNKPTATDWAAALNDAQWFADKCKAGTGEMLAYIGTTASARDMESIRVGLGVPKLDYLGFSYRHRPRRRLRHPLPHVDRSPHS